MSEIQIRRQGAIGHITLARPDALNALTRGMCQDMCDALIKWRDDPAVAAIMIDHGPGRGFCAGGDVAKVRQSVLDNGGQAGRAFFRAEYQLNHLLFTYAKPVITFMDGITMGGGVGIALPARYRVATQNTLLAMPETAIGLFPDVGAGWYLSRCKGRIGPFLALTGARLDGAECLWAGLATHYIQADQLEQAKAAIMQNPDGIAAILTGLAPDDPPPARLAGNAARIDHFFGSNRFEDILDLLAADQSPETGKWSARELATLQSKCPTSCKVALRQIAAAPDAHGFADEMKREYALACAMIARPDFAEGVRAVLVDKDHAPRWTPRDPAQITDAMLDALFAPLPPEEEWMPL